MTLALEPVDVKALEIVSNERDVLRDLFTYLNYVGERSIKRMTRTNQIPHADLVRMAKLLGIDPPEKNGWMYAQPYWIDFIDELALNLHAVSYDLQGEFRSVSSMEPSFIENYIDINKTGLKKFLELSPAKQEQRILDCLNQAPAPGRYDRNSINEFFHFGPCSRLDRFSSWGMNTGVMPTLKFPEIRTFLLNVLKQCPPGQWLSVPALIAYLKTNHPYFLIPQHLPKANKSGDSIGRYENFHEGNQTAYTPESIPPDAPDAFERVEGRYVERFLEHIPLIMRFVDLAYTPQKYTGAPPSLGQLKAFRLNERFLRLLDGAQNHPKVTVQPNFDVVVESDFYPAQIIGQLGTLGAQVSSPASGHGAYLGVIQLKKSSVAAALVQQPGLDVIDLLKTLSGRDLPPNVQTELDEWAGHAEQFVLYEGFGLLETDDLPPEAAAAVVERITPSIYLVRQPQYVHKVLEAKERAPLRLSHMLELSQVPEAAVSVFPKQFPASEPEKAKVVKVSRVVMLNYLFADDDAFEATQKMLAELRCPFQPDARARSLTIQQKDQARFEEALVRLADKFTIEVE